LPSYLSGTIVTPGQPSYDKEEHKKESEALGTNTPKKDESAGGEQKTS